MNSTGYDVQKNFDNTIAHVLTSTSNGLSAVKADETIRQLLNELRDLLNSRWMVSYASLQQQFVNEDDDNNIANLTRLWQKVIDHVFLQEGRTGCHPVHACTTEIKFLPL